VALAAAAAGAPGEADAADEQYGREMWARCEALTAGARLPRSGALQCSRLRHMHWPGRRGGNFECLDLSITLATVCLEDKALLAHDRPVPVQAHCAG